MSLQGQLEAFALPGLNSRYPFSYRTFAGRSATGKVRRKPTTLQPKEFDQADPDSRECGAQIRRQEIRLARRDVAAVT
jgi:hypothetical protein